MKPTFLATFIMAMTCFSTASYAIQCSNNANGFGTFKKEFARYAKANGIGKLGLSALANTQYSTSVIRFDRIQRKAFKKSFDEFYKLRTTGLKRPALGKLQKHAQIFANVEAQFGVPKEVLVTIWGMETAFGRFTGDHDVITSVATLTHDCRRSDFFRPHLLAALRIVDNGWMTREQLRGARHGEIGQTQFLANNFVRFGVDQDRNGKIDLLNSVPDMLASTANYLHGFGWIPGGDYQPGSHNFEVLKQWNAATVYQQAIAKFASTL